MKIAQYWQSIDHLNQQIRESEALIVQRSAIAAALRITFEEFEAEVANGENAYTLAQKLGVDFAIVQTAMEAVHKAAFLQASNDGLVSQEQADWILSRRGTQNSQGAAMNRGQNNGSTEIMVRGVGNSYYGTGECPYQTP
jgi:hypothetical protein